MQETLSQKWRKHYRNGGFIYAVYRGIKYLSWLAKKGRLNKH